MPTEKRSKQKNLCIVNDAKIFKKTSNYLAWWIVLKLGSGLSGGGSSTPVQHPLPHDVRASDPAVAANSVTILNILIIFM